MHECGTQCECGAAAGSQKRDCSINTLETISKYFRIQETLIRGFSVDFVKKKMEFLEMAVVFKKKMSRESQKEFLNYMTKSNLFQEF